MSGRLSVLVLGLLCALVGGFVLAGVASANTLPDGRIYEQVTPEEKYGSDVYQPPVSLTTSGLGATKYSEEQKAIEANSTIETNLAFQAAADGSGIVFVAAPTVEGNESQGFYGGNEYLARRSTSGWAESVLSPEGAPSTIFQGFSPDLTTAFANSIEPLSSMAPGFGEPTNSSGNFDTLYSVNTAGHEYVPLFSTRPPYRSTNAFGTAEPFMRPGGGENDGDRKSHSGYLALEGASAGDSHLLFAANDALTGASEGKPAAEGGAGSEFETENNLYDSVNGQLRLINVLPNGRTHANAAFGGVEEFGGVSHEKRNILDHVISADGSRIFWTDLSTGRIYMRENDTQPQSASSEGHCTEPSKACTVEVSASEKTDGSGPAGADLDGPRPAHYQSASSDGSKVFFTSAEELTNDADTGPSPTVARADLDGSAAEQSFMPAAAQAVAVDASHIYWADATTGSIGRANLDGTGVEPEFITGASDPQGLAVDASHLYWTNAVAGSIGRADLDGTGVQQGFITGASNPQGIAVDGAHIYWANTGEKAIGRANLDGSGAEQNFIINAGASQGIAVDAAYIYWTEPFANAIGRATLDGTEQNSSFITGSSSPQGIAVDTTHVYWSNAAANTVGRANLDGTGAEQNFIVGASNPQGLAVNAAHLYWVNNAGDREENLYRYEPGASEHLTDLTPKVNVAKVLGASEDGEYVYYVTSAKELILWHDGASNLVANVAPALAEVTPDGGSIVFMVTEVPAVVGQTTAHVEVYNADTNTLYCASCTSHGTLGMLPMTNKGNVYQPRWISADGSRVFFVTLEGLVPQDTNEVQDVYEWERPGAGECTESTGCVYLLSGGTSPAHSGFLDASENGDDVFIVTRASLVGSDEDDLFDVYDVTVHSPPVAPPACTGTGCQGVPNPTPIFATPSSVTFEGVGNFAAPAKETKVKQKPKKKPKPKKKKSKRKKKRSKAKKSARTADGRRRSSSKGGRS